MAAFISALSGEPVVQENALATVTSKWLVVPDASGHSRTLVAVSRVTEVRVVRHTNSRLLVVAVALFLLATASAHSHEGDGAALPMALIGLFFALGYIGSRRATVAFATGPNSEPVRTFPGSFRQADELAQAVQSARTKLAAD